MKTSTVMSVLVMGTFLSACGEKPQTAGTRKSDGKAWETTATSYQAGGFKAGDQAGWEQQMRQRAQSQNEYVRAPARSQ